jgi:hypothetical protein
VGPRAGMEGLPLPGIEQPLLALPHPVAQPLCWLNYLVSPYVAVRKLKPYLDWLQHAPW